MADHTAAPYSGTRTAERSGLAVGFIVFAAVMMMMSGAFQVVAGLVALFSDEFFVVARDNVFRFDMTTWGWIHLVFGVVMVAAGVGLLAARTWARLFGIALALLSAVVSFAFLPYYPAWGLVVVALDVFVIWALAAHGRDVLGG